MTRLASVAEDVQSHARHIGSVVDEVVLNVSFSVGERRR